MSIGALGIMERMSQKNNKDLKVSPLSNIISAHSGKDGWGNVTIACVCNTTVALEICFNADSFIFIHASTKQRENSTYFSVTNIGFLNFKVIAVILSV